MCLCATPCFRCVVARSRHALTAHGIYTNVECTGHACGFSHDQNLGSIHVMIAIGATRGVLGCWDLNLRNEGLLYHVALYPSMYLPCIEWSVSLTAFVHGPSGRILFVHSWPRESNNNREGTWLMYESHALRWRTSDYVLCTWCGSSWVFQSTSIHLSLSVGLRTRWFDLTRTGLCTCGVLLNRLCVHFPT